MITALIVLWACKQPVAPSAPEEKKSPETIPVTSLADSPESQWQKVLKGARSEGRIVLYGPPIAETRRGFVEEFQKAYPGITLEYTGQAGAQVAPKITAERRAGLYIVDVHIGGTTTILSSFKQFAVPIKPWLFLPEVKDPKAWLGGKLDFADDAEEIDLVFTINAYSHVLYNTELVDPSELTSFWDLTKPKWNGKIIKRDPRVSGGGLATATFWYFHPKLGLDFIKALAANKPTITREPRAQVETVARGKNSITISPDMSTVMEFRKAGMPIKVAKIMKEGTYSTASFGSVIAMDKAPHPNAARVFINWLLSKEGQRVWTTTSGYPSRRLDAPADHLAEEVRPDPTASYFPGYKEEYVIKKDEVVDRMNEIFAGF